MNRKNRKNRKWEDWEIRYLEGNYETGSMTVIEMADHIGRTVTRRQSLGIITFRKALSGRAAKTDKE